MTPLPHPPATEQRRGRRCLRTFTGGMEPLVPKDPEKACYTMGFKNIPEVWTINLGHWDIVRISLHPFLGSQPFWHITKRRAWNHMSLEQISAYICIVLYLNAQRREKCWIAPQSRFTGSTFTPNDKSGSRGERQFPWLANEMHMIAAQILNFRFVGENWSKP